MTRFKLKSIDSSQLVLIHLLSRGVFEGMQGDRPHKAPSFSVYEKVIKKNNYIKFIIKINIFTVNKAQNKSFAQNS